MNLMWGFRDGKGFYGNCADYHRKFFGQVKTLVSAQDKSHADTRSPPREWTVTLNMDQNSLIILRHIGVNPKWSRTFIEFSEFRESDKSLKHELGSI